ncbi:MAG: DUF169 domain-containing protein [Desulfotalea sp.]
MQDQSTEDKPLYRRNYEVMQDTLMSELKLKLCPIAVKFFYTDLEVEYFKKWHDFEQPTDANSFCHWEHKSRLEKQVIYLEPKNLDNAALFSFNLEDSKGQKNTTDRKEQLQGGVLGMAIAPLTDAQLVADTVQFYGNKNETEDLINEWKAVSGIDPEISDLSDKSPLCDSTVFVHNQNIAKVASIRSCAENTSEKEDDKYMVIIPGDHLKHLTDHLDERKISLGMSSLSRPGDGFFRFTLG